MEFFKQIPKSEARKDFLQILNTMAKNFLKPILITDHGKPQAVIISFSEYQLMKIQSEMYKKENKKSKKAKSVWGGLTLLDENFDKHSVWDEIKDEWQANWEKEFGKEPINV